MYTISNRMEEEALRERRRQINQTVEYLRRERLGLERNASCMDADAYRRRISLLDRLAAWYKEEKAEIDGALDRTGEQAH
jgi:hypothetical protein